MTDYSEIEYEVNLLAETLGIAGLKSFAITLAKELATARDRLADAGLWKEGASLADVVDELIKREIP